LKIAAKDLSRRQVRYLVDQYYVIQNFRIRCANQIRASAEVGEPTSLLDYTFEQNKTLENQIKLALDKYSQSTIMGRWSRSVVGIGPVIAAGIEAHIDIAKFPTAGHIWSFAGIVPGKVWNKSELRPWNARLKTLTWKIGDSFLKQKSRDKCVYGKMIDQRREYETRKNEAGDYADIALERVKTVGKDTEAYKWYSNGKLPPGHILARSKRHAVKIFLAHWHQVAYKLVLKIEPPIPFPIAHMYHVHQIHPVIDQKLLRDCGVEWFSDYSASR
jgi:hypothetical protein